MKLTREQILIRYQEFPSLLNDLRYNSAVVLRAMEAYANGVIATKEEAYCQMIIELAKTREELFQREIDRRSMETNLSEIFPI